MKLSEVKSVLKDVDTIAFKLPNGELVPQHFHVTEVGKISKQFIDCGGTIRNEEVVNLQLWSADDYDHRLHPEKLFKIIQLSEQKLGIEDATVEVEYQGETIQKFGIDFDGQHFLLTTKKTDCLAKEECLIPTRKPISLVSASEESSSCTPGGNCC